MEAYLKILLAYHALPQVRQRPTFMDVAGFPRRENVCSNILAFYLDPAGEHGLGDLLLSSFFRMAGIDEADIPAMDQAQIYREFSTEQGKRIDLVIDDPDFTIGIENKIDHWLANDLKEYAREIDRLGERKRHSIKAVLALQPLREALPDGFRSHTYRELWGHVRERLGPRITAADPRWMTHLIDFMENTERLTGNPMELKPTDRFFIDHEDQIQRLIADRNDFHKRLAWRVEQLKAVMEESASALPLRKPLWISASRCLVFDFSMTGAPSAALDLWLHPTGWELQIFGRDPASNARALSIAAGLLTERPVATDNNRYVLQRWPLQAELTDIAAAVFNWIKSLVEAAEPEPAASVEPVGVTGALAGV